MSPSESDGGVGLRETTVRFRCSDPREQHPDIDRSETGADCPGSVDDGHPERTALGERVQFEGERRKGREAAKETEPADEPDPRVPREPDEHEPDQERADDVDSERARWNRP